MACTPVYTINLKGRKFLVTSPEFGDVTPILEVCLAIAALKESSPKEYEEFVRLLNTPDTSVRKPDARRNRDLPFLIKRNLSKYHIDMEVLSESLWANFCDEYSRNKKVGINPNARSFFLDGKIYVRRDSFTVGDSMHELSHLLLAVMRGTNFKQYQLFIHTMYEHPAIRQIGLNLKEAGTYSDDIDLDFQEEAVVRYLEGVFTSQRELIPEFEVDGETIDTIDFINKSLEDTITKTFAITEYPGAMTFFKSLVCDVPEYGSEMFKSVSNTSIGYKEMKLKAIEAERVNALIAYYASRDGGNLIQKGECL